VPKYAVHVEYYKKYTKELTVYADDEDYAEEKALEIVSTWDIEDIPEPEVTDIFEE
jgi:hypothetical protein